MPEIVEEKVDITALIHGILNGYPGNSAILREYLQNSDDAKAKKQVFILDERSYPIDSLCDASLRDAQGPALLAVNDGFLSDRDWEALTKIHSSSKKTDESQTGKNGLGFRASYHLTENPHVLSGNKLMILDPHRRLSNHTAGLLVDIVKEGTIYPDHLKPFEVVDNMCSTYQGTVFRLPLRTELQAQQSRIKSTPTSTDQIRRLLEDFCQTELSDAILFLKHITTIEVRYIDPTSNCTVLGKVSIEDSASPPALTREVYFRRTALKKVDGIVETRRWCIRSLSIEKADAARIMSDRLGYDIGDSLTTDKLFPSVELAIPMDDTPITGSLFTLLPLPIKTGFPMHLNAVFALTPDRQNLKNIEEVGDFQSRERRLVEWNRTIFEVWAPTAWADLLQALSSFRPPWSIWPPQEKSTYWANLGVNIVREVVHRGTPIFPTVSHEASSLVALVDPTTLIASPSFSTNLLHLLTALGLKIVQPPQHIFSILTSSRFPLGASQLLPRALHSALTTGYQTESLKPFDPSTIGKIIEYLVFSNSPPTLSNLIGLPWFNHLDGSIMTMRPSGSEPTYIVPVSGEEARLFAAHPRMFSWSCLPDELREALLLPESSHTLNVASLNPDDIANFLSGQIFGNTDTSSFAWVLDFWTWLERSPNVDRCQLFAKTSGSLLLPTTRGLRRLSEKAVYMTESDLDAANAWEMLGVPILESGLPNQVVTMLINESFVETPEKISFIPFMLDTLDPKLQSTASIERFQAFRRSLYSALIRQHISPTLTARQKTILEQLSVFSVRNTTGVTLFSPVHGNRLYVNVGDHFPLPIQPTPVIYVDIRDPQTRELIRLLESVEEKGDIELLQIALEHWNHQSLDLQDQFVEQIFGHWMSLPPSILERLKKLPFITVNETDCRAPPTNLIHPDARITSLYEGEIGRIPTGRFAEQRYITILQNMGYLPSSLDQNIVRDRLSYLSDNFSEIGKTFGKSVSFIGLLNQLWEDSFDDPIYHHRERPWMPRTISAALISPNATRDLYKGEHADPSLYDLVLEILPEDILISNPRFRKALGWSDNVPPDVLVSQLRETILLPHNEDRYRRLCTLISYLSQLYGSGQLSLKDIQAIRDVVTKLPWIPVLASSVDTVETEYALFPGVELKTPFRQVQLTKCLSFFTTIGCTERPTLESMTSELQKYVSFSLSDTDTILALLNEITRQNFEPRQVLVPTQKGHSYPVPDVYYPDVDHLVPSALQDKNATHSCISKALADRLGVQPLSSLLLDLGEDQFEDDEQMGVDLIDRIQGFLREYDVSYALNEFLANADDAGATEFTIMLDCRRLSPSSSSAMISPMFRNLRSCSSIILFNNAQLSDADFKGLRRVGRGAKVDQKETHGRHGLGALSFYYFTDVVTVISGEYFMILDPSGRYLPTSRGSKRTSLIRKIADIRRHYPSHLDPVDSFFKFSKDRNHYDGTLFCLPLHTKISAKNCADEQARDLLGSSYRELAEHAFFFTRLTAIRAELLTDSSTNRTFWSYSAARTLPKQLEGGHSYHFLELNSEKISLGKWMISTTSGVTIPDVHETTASGLKLTKSNLTVQLAIKLMPKLGHKCSWLFSMLRLPRTSSFPFHLNARFAISSNRQSIVFDSPDSRKARDPKSAFNLWILTDVVPRLYLSTITFLIQNHTENRILPKKSFWLLNSADNEDIYTHAAGAFHALLATSDNALFKSINGFMLPFHDAVFSEGDSQSNEIGRALVSMVAPRLVTDYASSRLCTLKSARKIDAAYVRDAIYRTPLERIQRLYTEGTITFEQLKKLLLYIRKEPSLVGLPLIVLSTDLSSTIPGEQDECIYLSEFQEHAELFHSAVFLHPDYADESFEGIWSSGNINVNNLTTKNVMQLIRLHLNLPIMDDDFEREQWLQKFWMTYDTLPGPPPLTNLENTSLGVVQGSISRYSLRACQPNHIVFSSSAPSLTERISPTLLSLGIDIIKPNNLALISYLHQRFPPLLENVLQCLAKRNISAFDMSADGAEEFRTWLTSSIESNLEAWQRRDPKIDRNHLLRLQIWRAHTSQGAEYGSASVLLMLPPSFPISALTPYLLPRHVVASYSSTICKISIFCRTGKKKKQFLNATMSPQHILAAVCIPSLIPSSNSAEMEMYRDFLRALVDNFSASDFSCGLNLPIFDVDGNSRSIGGLYDHRIELFSTCLPRSCFVHPILRDVKWTIVRSLGLKFEISFDTFRTCAVAVQTALQDHVQSGNPTMDELLNMSRVAFDCYNHQLPPLFMRNTPRWATLDKLAFVRAKEVRRQGASYPAESYCEGELAPLLAPNRFVLPSLEPIAWTQRALFFDEPSENVIALNTTLGVPKVWEVVAHLRILTTRIAPNHPGNSTLLSDIKATYKWLNDHAEQAQEYVILLEGEKLFLNVDDPNEDWWVDNWVTAQELVLDLPYDYEDIKRAKAFLQDYSSLLLAAGCSKMSLFSKEGRPATTHSTSQLDIMKVFNEMRKVGKITDMILVPTATSPMEVLDFGSVEQDVPEEVNDEWPKEMSSNPEGEGEGGHLSHHSESDINDELQAHRVVLAATIPYIQDWSEGWGHDTKRGKLAVMKFNGTSFGAKAILDFIYTGEFNASASGDFESLRNLLYELFALLSIADEWNMPDLRTKIESEIIYEHDLVQRLLPLHDEMMTIAEKYNANDLKAFLRKVMRGNRQLLRRFSMA